MNKRNILIIVLFIGMNNAFAVETFGIKNIYSKPIYVALGDQKNAAQFASVKQIDPGQTFTAKIDLAKNPEFLVAPYYPVPGDRVFINTIEVNPQDKRPRPTAIYVHVNFVKLGEDLKKSVERKGGTVELFTDTPYAAEIILPSSWFGRNIDKDQLKERNIIYPNCLKCNAYQILAHFHGVEMLGGYSSPLEILFGKKEIEGSKVKEEVDKLLLQGIKQTKQNDIDIIRLASKTRQELIDEASKSIAQSAAKESGLEQRFGTGKVFSPQEIQAEIARATQVVDSLRNTAIMLSNNHYNKLLDYFKNLYGNDEFKGLFAELKNIIDHAFQELSVKLGIKAPNETQVMTPRIEPKAPSTSTAPTVSGVQPKGTIPTAAPAATAVAKASTAAVATSIPPKTTASMNVDWKRSLAKDLSTRLQRISDQLAYFFPSQNFPSSENIEPETLNKAISDLRRVNLNLSNNIFAGNSKPLQESHDQLKSLAEQLKGKITEKTSRNIETYLNQLKEIIPSVKELEENESVVRPQKQYAGD